MNFLTYEEAAPKQQAIINEINAIAPLSSIVQVLCHPNPESVPMWFLGKLRIAVTIEEHAGGTWLHASYVVTEKRRGSKKVLPNHNDTLLVRKNFFRPDSVVVSIFPPESEYVNEHARCLHLWERLDGPRLVPDLRTRDMRGVLTI